MLPSPFQHSLLPQGWWWLQKPRGLPRGRGAGSTPGHSPRQETFGLLYVRGLSRPREQSANYKQRLKQKAEQLRGSNQPALPAHGTNLDLGRHNPGRPGSPAPGEGAVARHGSCGESRCSKPPCRAGTLSWHPKSSRWGGCGSGGLRRLSVGVSRHASATCRRSDAHSPGSWVLPLGRHKQKAKQV